MNMAETLRNDVEQELRWDPSVCAEKIGVSVNDGVVELDGHVGSLFQKWAAERAALRVVNVTSVASEIIVDLPLDDTRTDADIAYAATSHLTWNTQVPDSIKVKVSEAWVTLTGTAEWNFQKDEAERIVRSLSGVTAVVNEIELKPKANALGVKIKIEDALKRDAQIDASNITVETSGAAVTLRGRVHSWRERNDAEHAAFGAPGVASVANLLTVTF
ncbi:osmotically-inducible protein OsmY [Granulicella aggregans]|uniref:Osmotically-inducible protein OsmY n=1 Tax=Granulicella aggregans TaxID=474949 RepID=A0A7W7ZJQ2_9BACT|nr:BON domain-containing protein [Granulicella aggregans]MBB5061133.1 osmotically-inducible protein OsmY [Granulicella aggregans]